MKLKNVSCVGSNQRIPNSLGGDNDPGCYKTSHNFDIESHK